MDRTEFYSKKREVLESLSKQFPEGACLVISVNPGNNGPCEVLIDNAARLIVEGTHKLASEEECQSFHAAMATARASSLPVDGLESARALFATIQGGKDRK